MTVRNIQDYIVGNSYTRKEIMESFKVDLCKDSLPIKAELVDTMTL